MRLRSSVLLGRYVFRKHSRFADPRTAVPSTKLPGATPQKGGIRLAPTQCRFERVYFSRETYSVSVIPVASWSCIHKFSGPGSFDPYPLELGLGPKSVHALPLSSVDDGAGPALNRFLRSRTGSHRAALHGHGRIPQNLPWLYE